MNDTFDYINIVKRKEKKRRIVLIGTLIASLIAGIYLFIEYQIGINPLKLDSSITDLPTSSINPSTSPVSIHPLADSLFTEIDIYDTVMETDIPIQVFPYQDSQYNSQAIVQERKPETITKNSDIRRIETPDNNALPPDSLDMDQTAIIGSILPNPEAANDKPTDTVLDDSPLEPSVTSSESQYSGIGVSYTTIADVMPSYPKGPKSLFKFLKKHLEYPEMAIRHEIQGKVFIQFLVDKKGSLSQFEVVRGLGYGCDEEALRVAKMMPAWEPGMQSGNPVAIKYTIPITFEIK